MASLPTLRQLTYLLALHEHQHFSRAAAACFVTQSALSTSIAELERLLETRLVERSKRSVRFTAVGEEVVARARGIMRAAEDLRTVAQDPREPLVGSLRMTVIPTIAPFLLPRIIGAVETGWPRLRLSVREMLTGAACEGLQRGVTDCVLLALPTDCGEVETYEIRVDRLLLASPALDVASRAGLDLDALDPARLLMLDEGHCLRDHTLAACNVSGPVPESRLLASTLHTLVHMVDAGLGMAVLPQIAVSAGLLSGTRIDLHVLQGKSAERRIALVWRRGDPRAADLQLLGRTIRDAVSEDSDRRSVEIPALRQG